MLGVDVKKILINFLLVKRKLVNLGMNKIKYYEIAF